MISKKFKTILQGIILAFIIFSCSFNDNKLDQRKCEQEILLPDFNNIHEVEPHFIITPDEKIVFSANIDGKFKLLEYYNDSTRELDLSFDYVINPLLIQDEIAGLWDFNSNERYRFTSNVIDDYLDSQIIKSAFSSPTGNYLLYILKNQNELRLLDLNSMNDVFISSSVSKTNNICFDKSEDYFVFSQDGKVFQYDIAERKLNKIFIGLQGKKLNLFTINDAFYFVNNGNSEFYNIYKYDLNEKAHEEELVLASDHDLRLPKQWGNKLYFLKVVHGEYSLCCQNLENGDIEQITNNGVVYDYQLSGNKIIYSYSDFKTPKCLKSFDINTGETKILYGREEHSGLSYSYIGKSSNRSGAYIFSPPDSIKIKGTILFIHPGLHLDFSPRWHNVLMGLCLNGFRIISPNYPGSSGYGKSYKKLDLNEALRDLITWKKYIVEIFDDKLLYSLTMSSGNILLEYLLLTDSKEIKAAVSFIGVSTGIEPDYSCPVLYVLGENDPIVPFETRKQQLLKAKNGRIKIISYPDEGHGIRNTSNMVNFIENVVCFFNSTGSN